MKGCLCVAPSNPSQLQGLCFLMNMFASMPAMAIAVCINRVGRVVLGSSED